MMNHFFMDLNWTRSGSYTDEDDDKLDDYFSDEDPNGAFETVVRTNFNCLWRFEIYRWNMGPI